MLAFVISAWAAAGSLYDAPDMRWDLGGKVQGDADFKPRIARREILQSNVCAMRAQCVDWILITAHCHDRT